MKNNIINLTRKIGVDKSIAYSSGARLVQAFTGVVSIFFIASFLNGIEQGFYFTFGSILAIQTFFELGLTGIITQYVAHEAVYLKINDDFTFSGEERYKSRLASLVHFSVKWYFIISVAFLLAILLVGYIFFTKYDESGGSISWKIPWLILSVSTAIKLFQSPFNSIVMGLGKVKEMNKIGFYQQLFIPVSMWICLICNFKLYVVGISSFLGAAIWFGYFMCTDLYKLLLNLWRQQISERVSYMKEIFPYQWKIALSWISGYFIFQLFNPVLFATEGAVVAGQMGMTLSVLSTIQAFSMSWLNTKIPLFSGLIELRNYKQLDSTFNVTLKQMSLVCLSLLVALFAGVWLLRFFGIKFHGELIGDRFLDYLPMILMMIPMYVNIFVNAWATYLRCHKKEPFLKQSIVMAILCVLSTFIIGKLFGLVGITIGYCAITLMVALPWGYFIYKYKKIEWHG